MSTHEKVPYTGPVIPEYSDLVDRIAHLNLPPEKIKTAYAIAKLAIGTTAYVDDLGAIKRIPRNSDGSRESVAQHSLWVAVAANQILDILADDGATADRGDLFNQISVHDATEIKTGDANTFSLTPEDLAKKKEREAIATKEMESELPGTLPRALTNQEEKRNWPARFAGLVDKLGPTALSIVGNQTRVVTEDLKVFDIDKLKETHDMINRRIAEHAGDDEILRTIVAAHMIQARHFEQIVEENPEIFTVSQFERNPTEIERKFLIGLKDLPEEIDLNSPSIERQQLRQAYIRLDKDGSETRVRSIDDEVFQQTKKSGGTIKRDEVTTMLDISLASFNDILKNDAMGNVIEKTRYKIPLGNGKILELDVYNGVLEGLTTGEVEFIGRDALEEAVAWIPPAWLTNEVTDESRFKNQNLAMITDVRELFKEA